MNNLENNDNIKNNLAVALVHVMTKKQEEADYTLPSDRTEFNKIAKHNGLEIVRFFTLAESCSPDEDEVTIMNIFDYAEKYDISNILISHHRRIDLIN